jgi:hypothetical protein
MFLEGFSFGTIVYILLISVYHEERENVRDRRLGRRFGRKEDEDEEGRELNDGPP